MVQEFRGVELTAMAACVPKNTVGNDAFSELLSPKELRLFEKTVGILERRWARDGVTASDLGFEAANQLFAQGTPKDEVGCVIFLSQTPDYKLPFTSNILQARLGLSKEMLCLDINAGCAGFVQGLSVAYTIASTLKEKGVLLIIAETMSRILSQKDRGTTMLFGDGAVAMMIKNTGRQESEAYFNFFSDGEHADAIKIPDGGYRNPVSAESLTDTTFPDGSVRNRLNLSMDGSKVFDFTLREIAPSIEALLDYAKTDKDSVDYFLLHQSNQFIIKQIAAKLGVSADKMLLNISLFGNTSGVSIPLLMASFPGATGQAKSLVCSGYGVGLNWGNVLIQNPRINIADTVEI